MKLLATVALTSAYCLSYALPASNYELGHDRLSAHDVVGAKSYFKSALAEKPSGIRENFMYGMVRTVALLQDAAFLQMLTDAGIDVINPNVYNPEFGIKESAKTKDWNTLTGKAHLKNVILPELLEALKNMDKFTDQSLLIKIGSDELTFLGVRVGDYNAIEADYVDALLLKTFLNAAISAIYATDAYNADAYTYFLYLVNSSASKSNVNMQQSLAAIPNFGKRTTDTAGLLKSKTYLTTAIDTYNLASGKVRSRASSTPLFNLKTSAYEAEADFKARLAEVKKSITTPTNINISDDEVVNLNLSNFFAGKVNFRTLEPYVSGSKIISGTFPDYTFAGTLPKSNKAWLEGKIPDKILQQRPSNAFAYSTPLSDVKNISAFSITPDFKKIIYAASDENGLSNVYVRDTATHKTTKVSTDSDGNAIARGAKLCSKGSFLSDDGRYAIFTSKDSALSGTTPINIQIPSNTEIPEMEYVEFDFDIPSGNYDDLYSINVSLDVSIESSNHCDGNVSIEIYDAQDNPIAYGDVWIYGKTDRIVSKIRVDPFLFKSGQYRMRIYGNIYTYGDEVSPKLYIKNIKIEDNMPQSLYIKDTVSGELSLIKYNFKVEDYWYYEGDTSVCISPNGENVAYYDNEYLGNYLYNVSSQTCSQLLTSFGNEISFSGNSKYLLTHQYGASAIIDIDTSEMVTVPLGSIVDMDYSGTKLLYAGYQGFFVYDTVTASEHHLDVENSRYFPAKPKLSADGKKVFFVDEKEYFYDWGYSALEPSSYAVYDLDTDLITRYAQFPNSYEVYNTGSVFVKNTSDAFAVLNRISNIIEGAPDTETICLVSTKKANLVYAEKPYMLELAPNSSTATVKFKSDTSIANRPMTLIASVVSDAGKTTFKDFVYNGTSATVTINLPYCEETRPSGVLYSFDLIDNNLKTSALMSQSVAAAGVAVSEKSSITISADISDCSLYEGVTTPMKITVISTAGIIKYLWEVSKNGGVSWTAAGSTTDTLKITPTALMNGYKYRCVLSNSREKLNSSIATLEVKPKARIAVQPKAPAQLYDGKNGVLSVGATGADLEYQWEFYDSASRKWIEIDGAKSDSYILNNLEASYNGRKYRCTVSNGGGSVISSTATLVVNKTVTLTKEPVSLVKETGETAVFTVTASGTAPITYQWYISGDESSEGDPLPKMTSSTLTLSKLAKSSDNNYYYCVVKNGGGTVTSKRALLNVLQKTEVSAPQTSVLLFKDGKNLLSVKAKAESFVKYQWQYYNPKTRQWLDATDDDAQGILPSLTEVEIFYEISAATFVAGTQYRCVVESGAVVGAKKLTSAVIRVTLCDRTKVDFTPSTHRPEAFLSSEYSGLSNANYQAVLAVTAKGTSISYEWQSSSDGGETWVKLTNGTGFNSAKYTTPILNTLSMFNVSYRCAVKNTAGVEHSGVVKLKKLQAAKVAVNPVNAKVSNLDVANFTISATEESGDASKLTYLWQVSTDNGATWKSAGGTKQTLSISRPAVTLSGNLYRCLVSNAANINSTVNKNLGRNPDASAFAKLEVMAAAKITTQPKAVVSYDGGKANFKVIASGYQLNYAWQYSTNKGASWTDFIGEYGPELILENISLPTGTMVRCLTWSSEVQSKSTATYSSNVTLTVQQKLAVLSFEATQAKTIMPCDGLIVVYADKSYPIDFKVAVKGYSPKYQWYNEFGLIRGATSATYRVSNPSLLGEFLYCKVENTLGDVVETEPVYIDLIDCPAPTSLAGGKMKVTVTQAYPYVMLSPVLIAGIDATNCKAVDLYEPYYFMDNTSYNYSRTSPTTANITLRMRSMENGKSLTYTGVLVFEDSESATFTGNLSGLTTSKISVIADVEYQNEDFAPNDIVNKEMNYNTYYSPNVNTMISAIKIVTKSKTNCTVTCLLADGSNFTVSGTYSYSKKGGNVARMTLAFTYGGIKFNYSDVTCCFDSPLTGMLRAYGTPTQASRGIGDFTIDTP